MAEMRCFISPAALLVKVIARMEFGGTPLASRYATLRVMTRVLPLPAAAMIKSGPSTWVTACRCGSVKSCNKLSVSAFLSIEGATIA